MHDALDAGLVGRRQDLVAGRHVQRIGIVAARRQAERKRQIGRPDIDGVEAGRGADRVEIGDAFLGLDHGHDDDLVVGLGHVAI